MTFNPTADGNEKRINFINTSRKSHYHCSVFTQITGQYRVKKRQQSFCCQVWKQRRLKSMQRWSICTRPQKTTEWLYWLQPRFALSCYLYCFSFLRSRQVLLSPWAFYWLINEFVFAQRKTPPRPAMQSSWWLNELWISGNLSGSVAWTFNYCSTRLRFLWKSSEIRSVTGHPPRCWVTSHKRGDFNSQDFLR